MLKIDGSYGEGGGQIVRSAIALSAVTKTDIKINNIRAHRPKPGLAFQHITAVKAVAELCNASYTELKPGIRSLEFRPKRVRFGKFDFDIGTAGSVTLVLQACILPAIYGEHDKEIDLRIRGGTDVKWSPQFDYFNSIFIHHLQRLGVNVDITLIKRGYYPKGGGEVSLKVNPKIDYNKLDFTQRGKLLGISGVIHSRLLPEHIPQRMLNVVSEKLNEYSEVDIKIDHGVNEQCLGPGTGLVLIAEFEHSLLGASALGEKGTPAEKVGAKAADGLITELQSAGAVDIYAADQLIPYLAMFGGRLSTRELSLHAKTNLWLVEKFLNKKFHVDEYDNRVEIHY